MSSSADDCGCCEGIEEITPVPISNPPGLSSIAFRVGIQPTFKETMIDSLNKYPALVSLTTRSDDDLTIDLFDAWATVGDVLTFYQERIANEGYLRTAKERVSVLQLARSIGYELSPGVAASAYLAFTLDTSVTQTAVNVGTKVLSVPLQGQSPPEMPQTFETIENIVAYPAFNALQPKLIRPQMFSDMTLINPSDGLQHIYFAGTSTKLDPGDKLLLVRVSDGVPIAFRTVSTVTPNSPSAGETDVALATDPTPISFQDYTTLPVSPFLPPAIFFAPSWPTEVTQLTLAQVENIISTYPDQTDLVAFLTGQGWDYSDFASMVNSYTSSLDTSASDVTVYAMRVKTPAFGSTAPNYNTITGSLKTAYPKNWDEASHPYPLDRNSQGETYYKDSTIYLANSFPAIDQVGWVVLRSRNEATGAYTTCAYSTAEVWDESRADFLINAKVTGVMLTLGTKVELDAFTMRGTTIYAQSELLELAEMADSTPVATNPITLGSVVANLEVGQSVAVTGQLFLQSGQTSSETLSEIMTITEVVPYSVGSPYTMISLASPTSATTSLANSYERSTFMINANVALATNGSTVSGEILGGGDPAEPYLTFTLKQDPLTFVSSPTSPNGAQSTLQVWVSNGATSIEWNQAPSLYGIAANSQSYAARIQDDLSVNVLFGNARPPVGTENITATYRVGTGSAGMVAANQLTLLASRPLGLKSVTNPLAASGAADPEDINDAREDAPLQVMTLGRIVSLTDVENFAASFQGIGKAVAISAWAGETEYVRLVVASAMQGQVEQPLLGYLQTAISNFSDPSIQVSIEEFDQLTFNVQGWIVPAADQDSETVQQNVLTALQSAFSFESMDFGEPVYLSEVISTIQGVEGVVACDVDSLYLSTASAPESNDTLACDIDGLLTLNPDSQGVQLIVRSS